MTSTDQAEGSLPERLLHFVVPGLAQGVGLWMLQEHANGTNPAIVISLALFLCTAPLVYFLATGPGRRMGAAVLALIVGLLIGGLNGLSVLGDGSSALPGKALELADDRIGLAIVGAGLAVAILVPFFRTVWERRQAPNHYPSLFDLAWSLPVVLAVAGAFVLAVWVVLMMLASLFAILGIEAVREILQEGIVALPLTCAIGALGIAIVRGRESVVLAMRGILMALIRAVAPVFAVAMAIFVVILAVEGFDAVVGRWSPVGTLAAAMLFGIAFFNGVIAEEGRVENRVLFLAAIVIGVVLVALALASVYGLHLRLDAEGLTVNRIYAALIIGMLALYGLAYGASALLGGRWALARQANIILAGLVLVVSLFVQSPLFGGRSWSVDSQTDRARERNTISAEDTALFAFDYGRPGRQMLETLAADETFADAPTRAQITATLAAEDRWAVVNSAADEANRRDAAAEVAQMRADGTLRVIPDEAMIDPYTDVIRDLARGDTLTPDAPALVLVPADAPFVYFVARRQDGDTTEGKEEVLIVVLEQNGDRADRWQTRLEQFTSDADADAFMAAVAAGAFGATEVTVRVPMIGDRVITPETLTGRALTVVGENVAPEVTVPVADTDADTATPTR